MGMMKVKAVDGFALASGRFVRAGGVAEVDEEEGRRLVHEGIADPPLRLHVVAPCLVGSRNFDAGETVDMFVDPDDVAADERFHRLTAVVPASALDFLDGDANVTTVAGAAMALPPARAADAVLAGGRFATAEEAAGLDLGAKVKPKPARAEEVDPKGPSERLYFDSPATLPDGRVTAGRTIVAVPTADVARCLKWCGVDRVSKVRVKRSGLVLSTHREAGETIEVPKSIARDEERFEPIGLMEKVAGATVDVLSAVGIKSTPAKASPRRNVYGDAR